MIRGATPGRRRGPFAVERVGEQSGEDLRAFLVEVVPAETAGQTQAVGQRHRCLAEQCELIEVVVQIRKEQLLSV